MYQHWIRKQDAWHTDIVLSSVVLLCRDKKFYRQSGDCQILGKDKYIIIPVSLKPVVSETFQSDIPQRNKIKMTCISVYYA